VVPTPPTPSVNDSRAAYLVNNHINFESPYVEEFIIMYVNIVVAPPARSRAVWKIARLANHISETLPDRHVQEKKFFQSISETVNPIFLNFAK
jgi:hypothetical protein